MALGTWSILIGGNAIATSACIVDLVSMSGGPNILPFEGYGAAAPVFINMGNTKIVRVFDITQEWASDTAAENYRQTAIAQWSGVATVQLNHLDYEEDVSTWTINNAKVELGIPQRIGLTTITRLTITGGS
ncbi:hypothetical protein [Silvimonas sp.]|uniref:hypothetical protein n=1 Tax=Silvimonas sp. TaxID=2650811 RepID=UPI002851B5DF|nr:hypothetical protein [Silvimonas sp.]MDR3427856.1 hypothetical protein [Silvimonas sp.]